jgi:hypothetical protein
MSKRKAPKFNTVLEDFRRFIGESKTAEESQGNNETSISKGTSDSEVNQALPGSGKATGSNSDKGLSMGVEATEKAPGTKEPTQEERSRKECSPSSKIAEDGSAADLVNKLLSNIKLATEELEKQAEMPEQLKKVVEEKKEDSAEEKEESSDEKEEDKEDKEAAEKKLTEAQKKIDLNSNGKIESKDLEALRKEDKPKVAEDTVNTEEVKQEGKEEGKEEVKEASSNEIDEDALAEKIAMHYRNVSVGYELGKFLFKTLEDKMAEEAVAPQEAPEAGSAEGSEIELILQALQELVQEGQISEEQAQQVLMQLQSATEGGAAPEGAAPEQEEAPEEATEEAPEEEEEEEPKTASLFSEKEIKEIETNINSKVAEWVSEGKTDKEITELVKQAAENDAKIINEKKSEKLAADANNRKLAALVELGYSTEQIEEYFKTAQQQDELNKAIDKMVCDKVAELKEAGKNDAEITEYLNQAAVEDAKLIKSAMEQESIQAAILNKVAEERKQKMANVSPEVQQILQALEALLQSGQISEEEAMQVLQELGLSGGGEEAAAAPAAPEAQAPVPPQAA